MAGGQSSVSQASSSQGPRRLPLQVFLRENMMLILLGAFAALTDWFSWWEMNIDEPSQYTVPLLCKRLLLASASVSTALLVLKWCLEYVQMNATLVQRKKGQSGDIELSGRSRLIDSGVDSQAATPQGPSPTAPIIARFHRPDPPRWLIRVITVLSGISVLNDSIDFINVVIILCAIGNPRSHAMGILISNLSLNLLNAIASAYKAMGFEASRERMQQLAIAQRLEAPVVLFAALGVIGALCAYWGWITWWISWIGGFLWWLALALMLVISMCETIATCSREFLSDVLLSDYIRLALLHVLIAELVYTTSTWITFFTIAIFSERVPTWLWHLYFLIPATETLILYQSLIATLEQKIDARAHGHSTNALRLCTMILDGLVGLICNALFLCYPTYQLQLLPIANIILTVAVVSCQLIADLTRLHHAELIDRIDQIRKGDTVLVDIKGLLDGGADPNMACGEPLYRAVAVETQTDSDRPLVRDAVAAAARIFKSVELLLEAGADPNLGTRRLAGGLVVAPLDEVVSGGISMKR
ncbi:unnamed protein product [Vitrella brassicaformis CCMP3155]|uniref:Uncharacterized protein n=1 Tax=Vitrella brassicaformis (strain CCMP3155) TaxID=1169540 RepID=A0A0G4EP96_VITBC|nr:unnamed protein product [Vitrella brassicaformis CCMP3155]|eukprot:CEL99445.1 unnamed protein product [Vitrella brassicaformis CCMP3155]